MGKCLISIVVPVYNEQLNIIPMYERITNTFQNIDYQYEIIYVDNCSIDDTIPEIRKLSDKNNNVHGILMSRNFGSSQPSTMAGLYYAKGNAVVLIDGDIQDPPELIPEFIKKWEEGYEIVYGIRKKRKGSLIRRIGYKLFYRIYRALSYIEMPLDAGDFGLIDRKAVDEIKKLKENEIFFRGIRSWVGFKQTGIEYVRNERVRGKTSISLLANIKWAKMGIFNFSYKPMEFISKVAGFLTIVSLVGIAYYIYMHFAYPETPYGFSTIVILILFLSAIQLLALSIMGEYISRIFSEVKGRPRYIVREIINNDFNSQPLSSEITKTNPGSEKNE
jgi:polyisoprenyl-phosphate glycosyltransferase